MRSHSLPDITEGSRRSSGEAARRRPRPGRKSEVTIDLLRAAPARSHPLGPYRPGSVGSRDGPRHATTNDLWYSRWKEVQPDPSFDIDGDGVVSSFDMAVAREFDKDNNGVLDAEETRLLRTALARKSLQQYSELPHGPQVASLVVKSKNATTIQRTPRDPVRSLCLPARLPVCLSTCLPLPLCLSLSLKTTLCARVPPGELRAGDGHRARQSNLAPYDERTSGAPLPSPPPLFLLCAYARIHPMCVIQSKIKRAAAGNSKNIQPGLSPFVSVLLLSPLSLLSLFSLTVYSCRHLSHGDDGGESQPAGRRGRCAEGDRLSHWR
eukprot:COSAG03_NODE_5987_length_1136_cov_1.239151_1_plen_322_part_01